MGPGQWWVCACGVPVSGSGSGGNRVPIDDVVSNGDQLGFRIRKRSEQCDFVRGITVVGIWDLGGCLVKLVKRTYSVIHFQLHFRTPKVSSMMASIDMDVEKFSLADQDDVGSGRVTPSSRSSRSSDHRRSRRHSPEYDRREGRAVSRRYIDDKDYRDRSEPSSRQGRDNRDYDIKRSRYETSRRTPAVIQVEAKRLIQKVKSVKKNDLLDMLVPRMLRVLLLIKTYKGREE
ncbi:hypothetical protein Tco_1161269 [Tanacetum coccineum]